jgi:hypothetical protein
VALCAGVLPVWGRQLAASRAQSEVAVTDMLRAFADIGPHIAMASRQSEQINDALTQPLPMGGVTGLMDACEQVLAPVLQEPGLSEHAKAAVQEVLQMVRRAVGALEQVARPFQHETQMVAEQVDRMYMGFQYQDRISQMMALLEGDIERLQNALLLQAGQAPDLSEWLGQLESQYAMAEQREVHQNTANGASTASDPNETTFF